jgi:hypothetical protein
MAMLALLVSGVVIHKKIFSQFFTFRPHKRLQRSSLDLHNLTGVVGLPFHFVLTLSGLIIFMSIYFPQAHWLAYGSGKADKEAYTAEAMGRYSRARANAPGTLAPLNAMAARAERAWAGGRPYFVRVYHPGDANSYVELRRSYARDVTMNLDQIYFDAATGEILHRFEAAPAMTVQRFISGMHFIQFEHWPLRWLYFCAGLSGCVLIATGFLFWLESRRARHAKKGLAGVRVVEGLAVGSITGIVVATLVMFAANRLLPPGSGFAGQERAALEVWAFYLAWIACFIHAWCRPRSAWREQVQAILALALGAVLLNWGTTGDHPVRALSSGLWSVAGMDAIPPRSRSHDGSPVPCSGWIGKLFWLRLPGARDAGALGPRHRAGSRPCAVSPRLAAERCLPAAPCICRLRHARRTGLRQPAMGDARRGGRSRRGAHIGVAKKKPASCGLNLFPWRRIEETIPVCCAAQHASTFILEYWTSSK